MSLLKFFDTLATTGTNDDAAVIDSNWYAKPSTGPAGNFWCAAAYEATDASCWYVFEGTTLDVSRRFNEVNWNCAHEDVTPALATRVETRAEAQALVQAHEAQVCAAGHEVFMSSDDVRARRYPPADFTYIGR